ncbi:hypothetical protein PilKf_00649 [Pillotina sp. SPG140]
MLLLFGCAAAATDPETPRHMVTFVTDGGSAIPSQMIIEGDKVASPGKPTRAGAFFNGWYADKDCTTPYFFTDPVTGPLTIYAKWDGYDSVRNILTYLNATYGGSGVYHPLELKADLNLSDPDDWTGSENNLLGILTAVNTAGKYVALDLSDCTMDGTVFDLKSSEYFSSGKKWIVSLILPDAAESIVEGTLDIPPFRYFGALRTVSGENIGRINDFAFAYCEALETASFPEVTTIGESAFYYTALETADFPHITSISESAFKYTALKETIFQEVTEIGTEAFSGCYDLVKVSFPKVTEIGADVFYNCYDLKEVNFINESLITIGNNAFENCIALETVNILYAKEIGAEAFLGCRTLKTVNFPEVEEISSYAFESCRALEEVNIPKVTNIGTGIFRNTGDTTLVIKLGAEVPTLSDGLFPLVKSKTVTVKVPPSVLLDYNSNNWPLAFTGDNDDITHNIKLNIEPY